MENYTDNKSKFLVIFLLLSGIIAGLFLLSSVSTQAQSTVTGTKQPSFSDALAANTLCSAGLKECDTSKSTAQPTSAKSGGLFSFNLFGGSSSGGTGHPLLTVINVEGQDTIYRIVDGKRHAIPNPEIFYSYGLTLAMVQKVSQLELEKYPLARLFIVEGDENQIIYYLTEGGMIRPVLNDKVFYSYGNRKEDVITINQKEFNFYPRNQFIFIERPQIENDIYQITGGIKRYLTPVAVKRMGLHYSDVAPVNQIEFDAYPQGEAVIF